VVTTDFHLGEKWAGMWKYTLNHPIAFLHEFSGTIKVVLISV
jgi:hypothetical protein